MGVAAAAATAAFVESLISLQVLKRLLSLLVLTWACNYFLAVTLLCPFNDARFTSPQ